MFKLYDYQAALIQEIHDAWQRVRSVLAVLSTGGGKTVIFSSIIHDHVGASAAIVHRKEIVAQISVSLARMGVKHRVVAPSKTITQIRLKHLRQFDKSFIDQHAPCGVISVQTLTSNSSKRDMQLMRWVKQVTLCVYDEGHHYVASGLWARAVEMMENAKKLFVTATPERADGKGMGTEEAGGSGFCEEMVQGPQTKWLMDNNFLSKFRYCAGETDLDVSDVAVTASGDFNAKAFRARVVESHLIGDVLDHYRKFADGLQTIVFATDVETAKDMAAAFNLSGIPAEALSGATESGVRDKALRAFESGAIRVLVNVDLFDEGFDVPKIQAVIMARPTQSLAKFLQQIGRALRIAEGKEYAIIIDAVRNWERHGMPNWPRIWTLEDRPKKESEGASDTVPQRVCDSCSWPYEAFYKACPYCGAVPKIKKRETLEDVGGDLFELDVAAMDALFEKMHKADCSDEEHERGQVADNIPPIGRPAGMRRHRADKYRRGVLRELVGWWVGMQPADRPRGEIYKRFYFRFGIDIATAFTLNAKETDALVEKIGKKFAADTYPQ